MFKGAPTVRSNKSNSSISNSSMDYNHPFPRHIICAAAAAAA